MLIPTMPEQPPPKQSPMRVLMIGTFDPDYTRNRQLVRLMRARGVDLRTEAVPLWGTTRFDAIGSSVWSRARLAWRVMAAEARVAWTFLRAERPDVVLVGFPGQLDAVVLGVLCRLRRVPMVLEFFISMHETMVTDRQLVGAGGLLARLLGWVDRTAVRLSAVVLADTPADAAFIAEVGGIDSHRVAVVPISPDPERFNPAAGTARSGEPGVVLFYGTFIPLHGIETIVRAAAEPDCAHLHFRLLGDGQQRRHIEQLAADIGAPVEFMDSVPEAELPAQIAAAQVCLGVFGTSDKTARVVPNKVVECLAVGRPVVTASTPAVIDALGDAVVTVPAGDHEALAEAVRALCDDPAWCEALVTRGHQRMAGPYGDEVLSGSLVSVLDAVASGSAVVSGPAGASGSAGTAELGSSRRTRRRRGQV
jgi:glycosyltransferase involved in cell wall biosynthesis